MKSFYKSLLVKVVVAVMLLGCVDLLWQKIAIQNQIYQSYVKNTDVATPIPVITTPSATPTVTAKSSKKKNIGEVTPQQKPLSSPKYAITFDKLPELHSDTILLMINRYRKNSGKKDLQKNSQLCGYANSRALYLSANKFEAAKSSKTGEHTGFKDSSGGYPAEYVGENMYFNGISDSQIVDGWKTSPSHNALLLANDKNGVEFNFGCVSTIVNDDGSIAVFLISDR